MEWPDIALNEIRLRAVGPQPISTEGRIIKQHDTKSRKKEATALRNLLAELESPQEPAHPPSSTEDGATAFPDKSEFSFSKKLRDPKEMDTFTSWATDGTKLSGYDHLLPPIRDEVAADSPPTVQKETVETVQPQLVPPQKEMLVSTTTDYAPKNAFFYRL